MRTKIHKGRQLGQDRIPYQILDLSRHDREKYILLEHDG